MTEGYFDPFRMIGISQDYKVVEKWTMTAHLRVAGHANFKEICRVQQQQQEKELSMRSIFESEEQVLKVIKAFQEHENPFVFSLTRKSTLKRTLFLSVLYDLSIVLTC